jgi:hypothetical protein
MATGSALRAARLNRGKNGTRKSAIAVEGFMACFGLLVAYRAASSGADITAGIPVLAGLAGTALSSAAVVSLVRKPARRFTAPGA